jgi:hypothetical protein
VDTNIREYVKAGLTNAIQDLEAQVSAWRYAVDTKTITPYSRQQLIDRLNAYNQVIHKQKELTEILNESNIWSNKWEVGRITRLIFQLTYFVQEDAEQIMTDITNGHITASNPETLH